MEPTLVIMAAGMGSRYGGLKQIDPVGPHDEIVLDYSVYDAIQAGFGKVVFIIRPDIEQDFKEAIGNKYAGLFDVEYVFQTLDKLPKGFTVPEGRTKPWGTGQAVLAARSAVHEPFAVINADDFYGRETFDVMARQLVNMDPQQIECCMVGFYIKNTLSPNGGVARGYCDVHEGKLVSIQERFQIQRAEDGSIQYETANGTGYMSDDDMVSMNTWGFTPRIFEYLDEGFAQFLQSNGKALKSEFFLPERVNEMIQQGEVVVPVLPSSEKWMGVTYAEDKPEVMAGIRERIDAGIYPESLWG